MKKSFKLFCLLFMIIIILSLSGCKKHYYDDDVLSDDITSIEILKLAYPQSEFEAELIRTLNDEEMELLLSELSTVKFRSMIGMELPNLGEYGIKIISKDGTYQIITFSSSFNYNNTGKKTSTRRWECSEEEFNNLVLKYIETEDE